MKYIILVFTFLLFLSCKKETDKTLALNSDSKSNSRLTKNAAISVDTIFFSFDKKVKFKDFALVHLIEKKYFKDSICNAKFIVDFIKNNKKIYSYPLQIKGVVKDSGWYGSYQLDTITNPLRTISFGYAACGYTQDDFLFYIDEENSELLYQWESMVDSGWGTWTEVVSGIPESFYCRTVSFSPEDDNEDLGIVEYSDSIYFKFQNNKWNKIYKTPKGKVYRSKKESLNRSNQSK